MAPRPDLVAEKSLTGSSLPEPMEGITLYGAHGKEEAVPGGLVPEVLDLGEVSVCPELPELSELMGETPGGEVQCTEPSLEKLLEECKALETEPLKETPKETPSPATPPQDIESWLLEACRADPGLLKRVTAKVGKGGAGGGKGGAKPRKGAAKPKKPKAKVALTSPPKATGGDASTSKEEGKKPTVKGPQGKPKDSKPKERGKGKPQDLSGKPTPGQKEPSKLLKADTVAQEGRKPWMRGTEWRSQQLCWNCREPGHRFSACTEPFTIPFCKGCGRRQKTIEICISCRDEWRKLGPYIPQMGRNVPRAELRMLRQEQRARKAARKMATSAS